MDKKAKKKMAKHMMPDGKMMMDKDMKVSKKVKMYRKKRGIMEG